MPAPRRFAPVIRIEPDALDRRTQRHELRELVELRRGRAGEVARRREHVLDPGEPDREPELAEREPVMDGTVELAAAEIVPETDQGGVEQRIEQLELGDPRVLRDQLVHPARVREQPAEPERIRGREAAGLDHRAVVGEQRRR